MPICRIVDANHVPLLMGVVKPPPERWSEDNGQYFHLVEAMFFGIALAISRCYHPAPLMVVQAVLAEQRPVAHFCPKGRTWPAPV